MRSRVATHTENERERERENMCMFHPSNEAVTHTRRDTEPVYTSRIHSEAQKQTMTSIHSDCQTRFFLQHHIISNLSLRHTTSASPLLLLLLLLIFFTHAHTHTQCLSQTTHSSYHTPNTHTHTHIHTRFLLYIHIYIDVPCVFCSLLSLPSLRSRSPFRQIDFLISSLSLAGF